MQNEIIKLPPGRRLSVSDLAAAVDCHPSTIRHRIEDGTIFALKFGGKKRASYKIPREAAERWIKQITQS